MQDDTQQIPPSVENVEQLHKWYKHFSKKLEVALAQRDRYRDLMGRRTTKKFSAAKIAQMARRLTIAMNEVEQAENVVDQVKFRLEQINSIDR